MWETWTTLIYSPKNPDSFTQNSMTVDQQSWWVERIVVGINNVTSAVLESSFYRRNCAIVWLIGGKISSIDILQLNAHMVSGPNPEGRYWFLLLRSILKVPDPKIRYQQIARYIEFLRQIGCVDSPSSGLQYLGDLCIQPNGVRPPTALNQSQTITIPLDFWIRNLQIGETGRVGQADFEYSVDRIMDRQTRPHIPSYSCETKNSTVI